VSIIRRLPPLHMQPLVTDFKTDVHLVGFYSILCLMMHGTMNVIIACLRKILFLILKQAVPIITTVSKGYVIFYCFITYKACSKKDRTFAIKTLLLILQHFKHCRLQSSPLYWRYNVSSTVGSLLSKPDARCAQ
jgi:hypothetical protein